MGILMNVTGTQQVVSPKNGTDYKLEELYAMLNVQMIEVVTLSEHMIMIIDEEGKLNGSAQNFEATGIFQMACNTEDVIMGNALVCNTEELQ